MPTMRPCLGFQRERCARLTDHKLSRCPEHLRKYEAWRTRGRPSARRRGYDREYEANRATLLARTTICWLCRKPGADTADHVVPVSKGGTGALANLRPAHSLCNNSRNTKPVDAMRSPNVA